MSVNGTAFEGINDIASSKYAGYNIKASLAEPGRIAQLAEHLLYTQGVTGSSPVSPTRKLATFAEAWCILTLKWTRYRLMQKVKMSR